MRMTWKQLLLAVAVGAGCSSGTNPTPPPPPPPPPPGGNSVAVTSNQFTPASLTVNRNATVTWNFNGGLHNITFEDGQNNAANRDSGTHTRTFGSAGAFRYRCTNHSSNFDTGMVGAIQVN
ncbi:MAG: plastocyanin/azurin family copper-binding protein [Gemmatimonadales bacterium]